MANMNQFRVTSGQLRAARSLVDYSMEKMAAFAGISKDTLGPMERGTKNPHQETWDLILKAYDRLGIVFTPDQGVRIRTDIFTLIESKTPYLDLLEDVFTTMRGTKGEVLFFYVDNSLSPQTVIDIDLRMRADGIHFRSIIADDKPYCLFPLKEYRCVPRVHFRNNPIVIYADKVGIVMDSDISVEHQGTSVHLVRNSSYAEVMRHSFDLIWEAHKMPKTNLAEVTYD